MRNLFLVSLLFATVLATPGRNSAENANFRTSGRHSTPHSLKSAVPHEEGSFLGDSAVRKLLIKPEIVDIARISTHIQGDQASEGVHGVRGRVSRGGGRSGGRFVANGASGSGDGEEGSSNSDSAGQDGSDGGDLVRIGRIFADPELVVASKESVEMRKKLYQMAERAEIEMNALYSNYTEYVDSRLRSGLMGYLKFVQWIDDPSLGYPLSIDYRKMVMWMENEREEIMNRDAYRIGSYAEMDAVNGTVGNRKMNMNNGMVRNGKMVINENGMMNNGKMRNGMINNEKMRNGMMNNGKMRNGMMNNEKMRNGMMSNEKMVNENGKMSDGDIVDENGKMNDAREKMKRGGDDNGGNDEKSMENDMENDGKSARNKVVGDNDEDKHDENDNNDNENEKNDQINGDNEDGINGDDSVSRALSIITAEIDSSSKRISSLQTLCMMKFRNFQLICSSKDLPGSSQLDKHSYYLTFLNGHMILKSVEIAYLEKLNNQVDSLKMSDSVDGNNNNNINNNNNNDDYTPYSAGYGNGGKGKKGRAPDGSNNYFVIAVIAVASFVGIAAIAGFAVWKGKSVVERKKEDLGGTVKISKREKKKEKKRGKAVELKGLKSTLEDNSDDEESDFEPLQIV